jgi:hypothetical protein
MKAVDLPKFQARLTDGLIYTLRARQSYFDPPEFRRSLNAAIEALRSSTWVLQKICNDLPGFEDWYQKMQDSMREDGKLRWLVDSRNRIIKQGDLEGHSTARISIFRGWHSEPFAEADISQETMPHSYAQALAPLIPEFAKIEEGLLRIDRRWVDRLKPDHEVTELLEHCCRQLLRLHEDLAELTSVPKSKELDDAQRQLLRERRDYMGCWLKLQDGQLSWTTSIEQEIGDDTRSVAKTRYSSSLESLPELDLITPLQTQCGVYFRGALTMLRVDGYALPFAFMLDQNNLVHQCALFMEDRAEKHIVFREVAAQARRLKAKSVCIVNEAWMAPLTPRVMHAEHHKERTEGLLVQGVDSEGECFTIIQPFTRIEGRVFLHAKPFAETVLHPIIRPIYEAIATKTA